MPKGLNLSKAVCTASALLMIVAASGADARQKTQQAEQPSTSGAPRFFNAEDIANADDRQRMLDGRAWVLRQAASPEALVLPSGAVFTIVSNGTGRVTPKKFSLVEAHLRGEGIDGSVFHDTRGSDGSGQPDIFTPNQVVDGVSELVRYMRAGDTCRAFLLPELAYGARGLRPGRRAGWTSSIPPYSAVNFTVQVVRIVVNAKGRKWADSAAELEEQLRTAQKTRPLEALRVDDVAGSAADIAHPRSEDL